MKITPLDIRQQQFEKGFRGYEKEAVDAYLTSLSQEWERVLEENRFLKDKLERTEGDYGKLKSLESALYKTMQLAETASQDATSKAEAEASEKLQSAQAQSDELLTTARKQASMLLMDAENKSRYLIDEAINELKTLERDYKAIEKYKDNLVAQIRNYANDALSKVQRFEEKSHQTGFEAKYNELNALPTTLPAAAEEAPVFPEAKEDVVPPAEEETFPTDPEAPVPTDQAEESGAEPVEETNEPPAKSESFFDKN
jgi:cell division initiation protein